jgi:hypothetical protein
MTSAVTAARRRTLGRPLVREAFIELVATAFLLIAVVGSIYQAVLEEEEETRQRASSRRTPGRPWRLGRR